MVAMTLVCGCGTNIKKDATPKFSTFSDHILSVSRQDTVSLLDAAKWVRSIGIEGVDAKVTLTDEQMSDLLAGGLKPACAIIDLVYNREPVEQVEDRAIEFCKKFGFERLMYCPPLLPADATPEMREAALQDIKAFAERAIAEGLDLLFEDYDNPRSFTYNIEKVDEILTLIPKANHTFDTGNFFFAGDDPMEAFKKFRNRISHVHIKDRLAPGNSASPAAGTGVVPCLDFIHQLLSEGYDGWFTIEGYGAKDMKEQLTVSVENMLK